ncbi:S1 RNA-binding domain-containing protein [Candidatus Peregrinibacteria bacterium]|nr:MAG: S1 RNA-binding domain-containing protein [Candidatus Peregrinibacteria bacterium]
MKRLMPDPWEEIAKKYPLGTKVKGVINRFSQFGAFVQLEDDINGLIHLSEISDQKVEDPKEFLSIGDEVTATVINIDREEHRIGLSLKKHPVIATEEATKEEIKAELAHEEEQVEAGEKEMTEEE